jgi:spermidine/putrescine transport system substrate-binding protein
MSDDEMSVWQRPVDRKGFMAIGALAALAAASGGRLAPDAFAALEAAEVSGTLYYYNWAAYVNPETYKAFEKASGVKVKKDFYASNEVLQAKLQAGARGYDLVVPTGYAVAILAGAKLLQPLDWSKLPTAKKNIDAKFKNQPYDPQNKWSIAKDWGTTGFTYRTDLVKEKPTSWKEFFDLTMTKYSGKVSLLDGSPEVIGSVAIRLGYSYSTGDSKELEEVRTFLLKLKPHIHSIDSINTKQKLEKGTTVMAQQWNGDGAVVASKKPALYVVPKEGAELWIDAYCIPKGANNPDAAHAWIDFVYSPKINSLETQFTYYGSPLKRNLLKGVLSSKILGDPAVFPAPRTLANLEPNRVTAKATRIRERIWTEFKSA